MLGCIGCGVKHLGSCRSGSTIHALLSTVDGRRELNRRCFNAEECKLVSNGQVLESIVLDHDLD